MREGNRDRERVRLGQSAAFLGRVRRGSEVSRSYQEPPLGSYADGGDEKTGVKGRGIGRHENRRLGRRFDLKERESRLWSAAQELDGGLRWFRWFFCDSRSRDREAGRYDESGCAPGADEHDLGFHAFAQLSPVVGVVRQRRLFEIGPQRRSDRRGLDLRRL